MEKLIIDRLKWHRGQGLFGSALLLRNGKMCCLGFDALRRGYTSEEIITQTSPCWLPNSVNIYPDLVNSNGILTDIARQLVVTNDDQEITDEEREAILTELFKSINIEVEFIN